MSSPDLSGKLIFYVIKGFVFGLAGHVGNTESSLFENIHRDSISQMARADSSIVGVQMVGFDFRYQAKKLQAKGELFFSNFTNTSSYNAFTERDLGSSMFGYYGEVGYDVSSLLGMQKKIVPFVRYSQYNTHQSVDESMMPNKAYDRTVVTAGFSFFLNDAVVIKADYQNFSNALQSQTHQFNSGIGFWFR